MGSMIAYLQGEIIDKNFNQLLIKANQVGYEVLIPSNLEINQSNISLYIHQIVRDDGHFLYGFSDKNTRDLFRELIKTNGIGPKTALLLISGLTIENILNIVEQQDTNKLIKVPGIGKKTAERLLLELKDRLPKKFTLKNQEAIDFNNPKNQAEQGLIALGFKSNEAEKLLNQVAKNNPEINQADELIRACLQLSFQQKVVNK